jgi:hypothetical protein
LHQKVFFFIIICGYNRKYIYLYAITIAKSGIYK